MKTLTVAAIALALTSCATAPTAPRLGPNQFVFEFYTQPSGAMVYWGDAKAIAVAPYVSTFNVDPRQVEQDVVSQKFIVVWASGAKLETTQTWKPKESKRWKFTFSRPVNAPGLDVDLRYATAQEAARAQQQAARANQEAVEQQRRDAALGQMLDGLNRGLGNNSVNCTSIAYAADWVRTTCR